MFISSKGSIYFQDGDSFFEVKKSCEKLIISSTSTDKVEEIDRIFEANEILRKTNSQTIEFEVAEVTNEAEEIAEEAKEDAEEVEEVTKEKPKQGRPAQKTKKVEDK